MKKLALMITVIGLFLLGVLSVLALGSAPSWQLNQGAPGTCASTSGFSLPGVEVNIPVGQASEQGVLSAPGFPNLGLTIDSAFGPYVGPLGSFFVFASAPYSLPANTPLTLSVTTFYGVSFTGGVSYVSTMTWDCTTGAIISLENGIPAPPAEPVDFCPSPLPAGSVVGEAPLGAQIYWEPAEGSASFGNTLNPGTYWVVGVDESGAFSKIWLTCNSQFWVPSNTLQPNYAAPWNGQPLPTRVVS